MEITTVHITTKVGAVRRPQGIRVVLETVGVPNVHIRVVRNTRRRKKTSPERVPKNYKVNLQSRIRKGL